jgi:hypothetical protein
MGCLSGKRSIARGDTHTLAIGKNRSKNDLLNEGTVYLMKAETYTRALTRATTRSRRG